MEVTPSPRVNRTLAARRKLRADLAELVRRHPQLREHLAQERARAWVQSNPALAREVAALENAPRCAIVEVDDTPPESDDTPGRP